MKTISLLPTLAALAIATSISARTIEIPLSETGKNPQFNQGFYTAAEEIWRSTPDAPIPDSLIVNFFGRLRAKVRFADGHTTMEFNNAMNRNRLSHDTTLCFSDDSLASYRARPSGNYPVWDLGMISTGDSDRMWHARLTPCPNVTHTRDSLLFMNNIMFNLTLGDVYRGITPQGREVSLHRNAYTCEYFPNPAIVVENEFGAVDGYKPDISNGRASKSIKTFGDIIDDGPGESYHIDSVSADYSRLYLTQTANEGAAVSLPEVAARILGPYIEKAASQGKLLLVDFWGTWCGPCIASMPKIESIIKDNRDKVNALAICVDIPQQRSAADSFLDSKGFEGDRIFIDQTDTSDPLSAILPSLEVSSFPTYMLIMPDGEILFRGSGTNAVGALRAAIER